jgi:hypothetical protein
VPFEAAMIDDGRLAGAWGGGALRDLSGGLWREVLCRPGSWPAAQPQHERRKHLLDRGGERVLLKFAGFGERARRALARAEAQAERGLAPPVLGLRDGFLGFRVVEGRPAARAAPPPVEAMARHVAAVADGTGEGVRFDDLLAMMRVNVGEGLGDRAPRLVEGLERWRAAVQARPAVRVDGRMLPQEWLLGPGGVLKADGIDHHDDHFWPGTQDAAWDLAGAAVEWGLGPEDRERLLGGFERLTGDRGARRVLPFHEAAYLAWRLGYASLAAETLGDTEDGRGMATERDRYAQLLRRALEAA